MVQKILVASLSQSKPMLLESVYTDGILVMGDAITLKPSRDSLIAEMIPRLINRRARGFKVLVDEVSGDFCRMSGASKVRLNDQHFDDRPVLSVALDRYQELRRLKSIITPQSGTGFDIPASLIDTTSNAKGETVYNINWAEITASHVLTILSVYATLYNRPGSADYISQVTATMAIPEPRKAGGDWLTEHQNGKEKPKPTLAGKTIDEDTIIL
ncbi:maturation control protein [Pantoea sp. LMR881]|uniref:maturation control protein n=1 Tax=Pantoea sp. LMR881 TaxID=3014336 RepID=UPI0022B04312|nr:maturation control protein [Pantoea sp. LMR881]MCZ4061174.1 maturation control protein [Pantoea sp. LMR881]MCZ4061286.1 maturation control protein [Pantoea sp. LMR881]